MVQIERRRGPEGQEEMTLAFVCESSHWFDKEAPLSLPRNLQIVVIVKITTDVMEFNMGSSTIFTCIDMIIKSFISEKMKGVEVYSKGGGG